MKFLIVDDEHALYRQMFADLLSAETKEYDVEEIPRMIIPMVLRPLYNLHFSDFINRHIFLPLKWVWVPCYQLHKYHYNSEEEYYIILLNGSLRYHFSKKYLSYIKERHANVKLVLIMYDSFSNPSAKRSIDMIPLFDVVFSFDGDDCRRHGFERIYSTFSKPNFVYKSEKDYSSAFFVGFGQGRLEILQKSFAMISSEISGCKFMIAGVKPADQLSLSGVTYNMPISYERELQLAYNTDCVIEVVREGQSGISLRTCEAIAFNKKLLTNNRKLAEMPFYDSRYMSIFETPDKIDLAFLKKKLDVKYENNNFFSPLNILRRLVEMRYEKADTIPKNRKN